MNYKHILILLSAIALSSTLSARTAKILYFKAPAKAPTETYIYQDVKDPLIASLPRNNFTETIQLKDGDIKLYFLPKALPPEFEAFPKNTPHVVIPASWSKVLILASSDPDNKVFPVRFLAVNANTDKIKNGDLMFINSSNSSVFGFVGSKKLALKPKSKAIIKNPARPSEEYTIELNRIHEKSDKPVLFYRKIYRQSVNQSALILFYNSARTGRLSYYCAPIRDL